MPGGRKAVVPVRLSAAEVARLDAIRGGLSRSAFLRLLLTNGSFAPRRSGRDGTDEVS